LRATPLAGPRLLDFVEEGAPVADMLFEHRSNLLLHRTSVASRQRFE
jgi:hypothetical protein